MLTVSPAKNHSPVRSLLTCLGRCGLLLMMLWPYTTAAKQRAYRVYDQSSGLPVPFLSGFAQDSDGFFWLGTAAGLYRFDGVEFRHWAKDKISGWYYQVYAGPQGEVLLTCLPDNTLYRVMPDEKAEVVSGPDGSPFQDVRDAAFTLDGRFWVARADALFYRNESQQWVEIQSRTFVNDAIRKISPGPDGSLWIAATHSLWKIEPNLRSTKLLSRNFEGYIGNVIAHPDGSVYFMEKYASGGKIFQWRDAQVVERIELRDNLHDFVIRGNSVWASADHHIVVFRPDRAPEVWESGKDVPVGSGLVVDREGSLWISDGRALYQMPEPETEVWTARDGLPDGPSRALHENGEAVWLSTWSGVGHLQRQAEGQWLAVDDHLQHKSELCSDGKGNLWLYDFHDFWQRRQGGFIKYPQTVSGSARGCDTAPDGAVWFSTSRGLWRLEAGKTPALIAHPFVDDDLGSVFEDSKGRLWLNRNEDICNVAAQLVRIGQAGSWSCQTIKGARSIGKPVELTDGSLWAGTDLLGVWSYNDADGWRLIPNSLQLKSNSIGKLVASPSGGVWVIGKSSCIRVLPRPNLPGGWQAIEQSSDLQGIPGGGVIDLLEESNGNLWVATANGIAHLPAVARHPKLMPPVVKLVTVKIDGVSASLTDRIQIPANRNQVEFSFAALSYRDRSLLKYQFKLHARDAWSDKDSNNRTFNFYDLPSGDYEVAIRASLDGTNWSTSPALIRFEVLSPWYLHWWALVLFVALVATLLLLAHQMRVSMLLKLESQRHRIAMDLHDEIGSGLGSIGILSGVAASEGVADEQRREITKRIAETADDLGASLHDIVWTLRPGDTSLESLAYHLAHRVEGSFPNGTNFQVKFPEDWDGVQLSLAVRRNVLLIAMESIHNAAKHAQAENVILEFVRYQGKRWQMRIEDDGLGLEPQDGQADKGMGIRNMIRRADEIGAQLEFLCADRRGTVVLLTFNPQTHRRRRGPHMIV